MSFKLATHLYRNRHGTFYFRLALPRDLRSHVQQNEIRFSLHTEQRRDAMPSAALLIASLPNLIADLRRMADKNEAVPPDYFKLWKQQNVEIAALNSELAEQSALIEQLKPRASFAQLVESSSLQGKISVLKSDIAEQQDQIALMVPRARAEEIVEKALNKGRLSGIKELGDKLMFPWAPEKTALFSELKVAYLKAIANFRPDSGVKKPPSKNTLREYERSLDLFISIMGDCRIGEIKKNKAVGEYFMLLKQLPAHMNVKAKYRGKTIPELLAMNDPPQAEVTCSQKIERISYMFDWALEDKREWGIDANPFSGFGQAKSDNLTRRPFTNDELLALLNHPDFANRSFTNSYTFWLIPLATYTGARLGELAQLDLKDFIEVDGIPCIDINDIDATETIKDANGKKKRVKNHNAKRLVPIHGELIRIGILRHVDRLRHEGQQQLFPELNRDRRGGAADCASKWFQRFRKTVGVTTKQETVFHSFRHMFVTNILDAGIISPHMLAPIVGHERSLITGQVYWNVKNAKNRQPAVEAFSLPESVRRLFPVIEEVAITLRRGPHSGQANT